MRVFMAIILFWTQVTFANECPEDIQIIEKGQVANCDGLLFSKEAALEVDKTQKDAKYYKELSTNLLERRELTNKEISVLDKRLKIYMDQSTLLAKEVHRKEKQDKWQQFIWFGLGVLATGVAVHGAGQLK